MLSEEFSAVRTALRPGMTPPEALAALAALSAIERHVQDMETALERIGGTCDGVVQRIAEVGEPPAALSGTQIDAERMRDFARAALPASPSDTLPAGRGWGEVSGPVPPSSGGTT